MKVTWPAPACITFPAPCLVAPWRWLFSKMIIVITLEAVRRKPRLIVPGYHTVYHYHIFQQCAKFVQIYVDFALCSFIYIYMYMSHKLDECSGKPRQASSSHNQICYLVLDLIVRQVPQPSELRAGAETITSPHVPFNITFCSCISFSLKFQRICQTSAELVDLGESIFLYCILSSDPGVPGPIYGS